MTTGVRCRADPRCEVPAAAETGIRHRRATQANKAGATIKQFSPVGQDRRAWFPKPDKELER